MKKTILLFLILSSLSVNSQDKINVKQNNQISERDSIISLLKTEILLNQKDEEKLKEVNQNLQNELIIYKAKEDYFASALADQSTRFALIISSILAGLALITFSFYKIEKKLINKRFRSFKEEFDNIKEENLQLNSRISRTTANAYIMIAQKLNQNNDHIGALKYNLETIKEGMNIDDSLNHKFKGSAKRALERAIEDLKNIRKNEDLIKKLKDNKTDILRDLDTIHKIDNDKIKLYCSKIRVSIEDLTQ